MTVYFSNQKKILNNLRYNMRFYKQTQGFSCGPACARMMLHSMGIEETEEKLIAIMEAAAHQGTPRANWHKLAAHYHLDIIAREPGSLEELIELKAAGWQITLLVLADVPHYVVFLGVRDGRVYMHDPWSGPNYSLLIRNFLRKWEISPEKWRHDSIYNSHRWFVALNATGRSKQDSFAETVS